MAVDLLRGDLPLPREAVDDGVVLGQPPEPALAQQVGPGVADVHDLRRVVRGHHGGDRRAHAGEVRVGCGLGVHHTIRRLDRGHQRVRVVARLLLEGADGAGGGNLAGAVAPHAVGDGEEGRRRQEGVLVVRAHQPDIGRGGVAGGASVRGTGGQRRNSSSVRPMRARSPRLTGVAAVTLRLLR